MGKPDVAAAVVSAGGSELWFLIVSMLRILAGDDDDTALPAVADISNEVGGNKVVVAAAMPAEVEKSASLGIL